PSHYVLAVGAHATWPTARSGGGQGHGCPGPSQHGGHSGVVAGGPGRGARRAELVQGELTAVQDNLAGGTVQHHGALAHLGDGVPAGPPAVFTLLRGRVGFAEGAEVRAEEGGAFLGPSTEHLVRT